MPVSVVYSLQALRPGALLDWPAAWGEGFFPEGSQFLPVVCEESCEAADIQSQIFSVMLTEDTYIQHKPLFSVKDTETVS